MLRSAEAYRESLRRLSPRVFVNGRRVESVADDPELAPGVAAIGLTYDAALHQALHQDLAAWTVATQHTSGRPVNRMLHIPRCADDLLRKLEAVRRLCQQTGCADIPARHRMDLARLIEDLTASDTAGWYSLISLHGGGSPEAMKMEIYRQYPLRDRAELVAGLLERGVLDDGSPRALNRQPDRCCAEGCQTTVAAVPLPRKEGVSR